MTDLRQLETDLAELAQLREHVKFLEKDVGEWRVQSAILARRLDQSERKRIVGAQTIGELVGALNSMQLMLDHLFATVRQQGYKPSEIEPTVKPEPAAPIEGGGKVDDGAPIPGFLQEFNHVLNGGKTDDVQQPVRK